MTARRSVVPYSFVIRSLFLSETNNEGINVYDFPLLLIGDFNSDSKEYSVMGIEKVVNNFDIVKEIGEDNIKKIGR